MGSTAPTKLRGRPYVVALFKEIHKHAVESVDRHGAVDIARISILLEDAMADPQAREHLASFVAQYLSSCMLGSIPDLPGK
jgi:hypothetical protein